MIFLGTCQNILESTLSPFGDATEMAQAIENSSPLTPLMEEHIQRLIRPHLPEFGIYQDILWGYDSENDIHYFFRRD